MKFLKISTGIILVGTVVTGALLFWTSQNVQQNEDHLRRLQYAVQSETQSIRVLEAEWDYLNRPERLEFLAVEALGFSSVAVSNILGDGSSLPQAFVVIPPDHEQKYPDDFFHLSSIPVPRVKPNIKNMKSFDTLLNDLSQARDVP